MVMWYVSKVLGKERVQMLKAIDDFVWGVPLIVLILAVGIFLTIRLRGLQITKLPLAIKHKKPFPQREAGKGLLIAV